LKLIRSSDKPAKVAAPGPAKPTGNHK
jgi:hypothetical protein